MAEDDGRLVEACLAGDVEARARLRARHGPLVHLAAARAVDDAASAAAPLPIAPVLDTVWARLLERRELQGWAGTSLLGTYLAVRSRRIARAEASELTAPRAGRTVPEADTRDLDDPTDDVLRALERVPPPASALVRLRFRGLSRHDIAATLGMSQAAVGGTLDRVADRLKKADDLELESAALWRALLDASSVAERVDIALATELDPEWRRQRAVVERVWRRAADALLAQPTATGEQCLDDAAVAGLVDGSIRGKARARAEGHLAACPRCIDLVASLILDLKAQPTLRDGAEAGPWVRIGAAAVATGRFGLAERLLTTATELGEGPREALADLRRLAQAGTYLDGAGPADDQTSQVIPTPRPSPGEAPVVAFEALVLNDPRSAWLAVDDSTARGSLGARLRLLAAAAGQDLETGRLLAQEALRSTGTFDPGWIDDAEAVLTLPRGRALPREVLHHHLRALVHTAVRHVLTRAD